jgi:hypothetical protein
MTIGIQKLSFHCQSPYLLVEISVVLAPCPHILHQFQYGPHVDLVHGVESKGESQLGKSRELWVRLERRIGIFVDEDNDNRMYQDC